MQTALLLLGRAEARAIQDREPFTASVLTSCDPRYPGKLVAHALNTSPEGGRFIAAVLVAETLEALRAQLPAGVSRHDMPPDSTRAGTVELWD